MSSSPMFPTVLPLSWSMMLSSERSLSTPDRLSTITVLSLTSFAELSEAIMPAIHITPSTPVSRVKTIKPTTVAAMYLKKSFIKYALRLKISEKCFYSMS